MTPTTVYIVRHGENPANITREFSHRIVDYPLTERGRRQAAATAAFFADKGIAAVYSSPLKRARETAEIIAEPLGLPVQLVEQFREVNVGALEHGAPTAEAWKLHDHIISSWIAGEKAMRFPDGENYDELVARVRAGLCRALAGREGERIVIAAHAGVQHALRDLCQDFGAWPWLPIANCSITETTFELRGEELVGSLVEFAACAHLSDELAQPPALVRSASER